MNKETVLDRIKKIIENNDLTNSEFAEIIGVPKSSISHLLSKRNKPSLDVITKISENFDEITADYLIFGSTLSKKDQIKPSEDLFSSYDIGNSKDSVKGSNNKVKSIIIIYENNKFEQIDKLI
jgi:transcriptional regulator with XRE-family HTH domain